MFYKPFELSWISIEYDTGSGLRHRHSIFTVLFLSREIKSGSYNPICPNS